MKELYRNRVFITKIEVDEDIEGSTQRQMANISLITNCIEMRMSGIIEDSCILYSQFLRRLIYRVMIPHGAQVIAPGT